MVLAMVLVGLFMGVALSVTVAVFGVLGMGGGFRENLEAAARECRERLTGRRRPAPAAGAARSPESDARLRALQEEVRVMQRLLEKSRAEKESTAGEIARAAAEVAELRRRLEESGARNEALEQALADSVAELGRARDELVQRGAELARSRRDLKDLETELGIVQSGVGLGAFSAEIERLTRERDELRARIASG